jgi:hypothetical protein
MSVVFTDFRLQATTKLTLAGNTKVVSVASIELGREKQTNIYMIATIF